jgi:hypothetical protein
MLAGASVLGVSSSGREMKIRQKQALVANNVDDKLWFLLP